MPKKILGTLSEYLIDNLDEACLGIDKEGRIHFINVAACTLFAVDSKRVLGQKIWDVLPLSEFSRAFIRMIKESNSDSREQVVHFGDQRSFLAQMSAVRGSEGRLSGAVALLRDISSLQRIESDVSDLVTRLSQELKGPITTVKGYVETLLQGGYADAQIAHRFLQIINEETNRMTKILVGLLEASAAPQPAQSPPAPVNLGRVAQQVGQSLSPLALQRDVELNVRLQPKLPSVMANEALLEQAITNLVDNAIKFCIQPPPIRGQVVVALREENGCVVLKVQDNGIGIAAAEQQKIFDRFYRIPDGPAAALGGTGLGLSITRDIVQGAGGTVRVESTPGQGSTFIVTLPAVKA